MEIGDGAALDPTTILIELAVDGVAALLKSFHRKKTDQAAEITGEVELFAVAILKKTAEVKGLQIDWNDATAVLAYVQSLPTLAPLPIPDVKPPGPLPA